MCVGSSITIKTCELLFHLGSWIAASSSPMFSYLTASTVVNYSPFPASPSLPGVHHRQRQRPSFDSFPTRSPSSGSDELPFNHSTLITDPLRARSSLVGAGRGRVSGYGRGKRCFFHPLSLLIPIPLDLHSPLKVGCPSLLLHSLHPSAPLPLRLLYPLPCPLPRPSTIQPLRRQSWHKSKNHRSCPV